MKTFKYHSSLYHTRKGANAKFGLQEAQHGTTYLVFLCSRGVSSPTTLLFMLDSVYPEILKTTGLSCKNAHKLDLAAGPLWIMLTMKNSLLESLFDRSNLHPEII